tara:strand:+ start:4526 stop:4951 length:426 start_codon:yes stop_codon:yes gene_type:complete
MEQKNIHSTSVVVEDLGIMIIGGSGSGKSDLALRLIDSGATLISDDITICKKKSGFLYLEAHQRTKGLLEVRELGIMTVPFIDNIKLSLVVELTDKDLKRYSGNVTCSILGVKVPKMKILGKESSAVAKIKIKLNQIRDYA